MTPFWLSVRLPCGLVFPNHLCKAAMAENLATSDSNPNEDFNLAYSKWSYGGWGMIITGNVQVDVNHLGNFKDPAKAYAEASQKHGTPTIIQIAHRGRQSLRGAGRRGLFAPTIAPSAIPLSIGTNFLDSVITSLAFPKPRETDQKDIHNVIQSGFSGIELHAAHGYLLETNHRTDAYGGSAENRVKLLEIIKGCREVVPATFCIGIKLNSADHSVLNLEDTMTQIRLLVEAGIDFLEVSGGTYENPRRFPNLVLMLTGGFRSRAGAEAAIRENACDLVGIARPAAVNPKFAALLLDEDTSDEDAQISLDRLLHLLAESALR
ncbi:hypothetical protein BDW75DRAFT_234697 [Aspergillus navahoensis]